MSDVRSPTLSEALRTLSKRRDDRAAWEELYSTYWRFVVAIASRYTTDFGHAEDVAQDVFLRIARYCDFEKFSDDHMFRAYVGTVALNRAHDVNKMRRHRAELEHPLTDLSDMATPSSDFQDEVELKNTVDWLMGKLTKSEIELVRNLAKGLTLGEIAAALSNDYGTVAVRVYRLRQRLKQLRRKM